MEALGFLPRYALLSTLLLSEPFTEPGSPTHEMVPPASATHDQLSLYRNVLTDLPDVCLLSDSKNQSS